MQYNYVLFDCQTEYYRIARHDLESLPNVLIKEPGLSSGSKLKRFLFRLHTSGRLNKHIILPFQRIWNSAFVGRLDFGNNKPICFIFTGGIGNLPYQSDMFKYLRKTYPDCKLVLLLRDILTVGKRLMPGFDEVKAKQIFDKIYTINNMDAEKYGFQKIHSFCSQYPIETSENDKKSDVVFIGVAKDRVETVRRAYKKFTASGLTCDFLLVSPKPLEDIPKGLAVQEAGIPYSEMLRRTINSKCIFEVTQRGTDALTSRCLEALCYNKKLISDNFRLKETKYYDPRYMFLFTDIDEVDVEFIKENVSVDYNYDGSFSPVKGLELIEKDLLDGRTQ